MQDDNLQQSDEPTEKWPANPYKNLYWNPSMPAALFAKRAQKYHNFKDLQILKKAAKIAGYKVVPSHHLNWRQRKKYSGKKFRIGNEVYYFIK